MRPVVNTTLRVDDQSASSFHFDLSGKTVIRGKDVSFDCPTYGYPKPVTEWEKNGKKLDVSTFL